MEGELQPFVPLKEEGNTVTCKEQRLRMPGVRVSHSLDLLCHVSLFWHWITRPLWSESCGIFWEPRVRSWLWEN